MTPDPSITAENQESPQSAPAPAQAGQQDGPSAPVQAQARPPIGARPPFVPRESREDRDRRRREALAGLVVGEWREGKVTGIAAFGAFVDLGGVDGLVHVSQLGTGGFVERVEDVVQVGQVVRVRVAEVDTERGRVSLSMREPRPSSGPPRERFSGPSASPGAPAPSAPRPARPAPQPAPSWSEPAPEGRPHERPRRHERSGGPPNRGEERAPRRSERPRRKGDGDEEWRQIRGDVRGYFSTGADDEEEPAPTTAEELVARFGRRGNNR